MNKNKERLNQMILTAIFGAIIFVLGMIPNVGYIQILPGVAITIIHIPVIIAVFVLPLYSVLSLGFIFGLSSLIVAATRASEPFDMAFIYPWISILPRMLFAAIAYYILKLFKKLKDVKYSKTIIFIVVTIITSVTLLFSTSTMTKNVVYNDFNNLRASLDYFIETGTGEEVWLTSNDLDDRITNGHEYQSKLADLKVRKLLEIEADEVIDFNLLDIKIIEQKQALEKAFNDANIKYEKANLVVTVIVIVILVLIVGFYVHLVYFSKFSKKYFHVPSVFMLSTFMHTIFVVGAVTLFRPKIFYDALGDNVSLISIILGLALTNGLVEALFGALVGTPVVVAISNRLENE